jgi:hypothetical protein
MRRYRSQRAYGIHGLHICTPVSLLVCKHFVEHSDAPDVFELFSDEVIDRFMTSSHDLYMRRYRCAKEQVLLSELMDLSHRPACALEVYPTCCMALWTSCS